LYLFATQALVKYSPQTKHLYIYIKTQQTPENYTFAPLAITNGKLKLLKKFNYFYNGYYYVGEKYFINAQNSLFIKPVTVRFNSKTYTTAPLSLTQDQNPPVPVHINIKQQKPHFLEILILSVLIYLLALFILHNIKLKKAKEQMGYFENDIKKFYYYLALNGFKEVEQLNRYKNLFNKKVSDFEELANKTAAKTTKSERFYKEYLIFGTLLLVLILFRIVK